MSWRWSTRVAGPLVVLPWLAGWILDLSHLSSAAPIFAALSVASAAGIVVGARPAWSKANRIRDRVAVAACAYLAWRVSWFPIMVAAGTGAAVVESTLLSCGVRPWVYPTFLVLAAALHAVSALLAGLPFLMRNRVAWAVVALAFAPPTAISLSGPSDLHPLPDRCWDTVPRSIATSRPVSNPYLPALSDPGYRWHQRLLLAGAGYTYELIPASPWSRTVQGSLEALFHENPHGSTTDRVKEHYWAYLAAHRLIGTRHGQQVHLSRGQLRGTRSSARSARMAAGPGRMSGRRSMTLATANPGES